MRGAAATDWLAYFAGRWNMNREIGDRRAGLRAAAAGACDFLAGSESKVLVCEEALVIDYGGNRFNGVQSTIWRFEKPSGPDLYFQDGRYFCSAQFKKIGDIWRAQLTHHCGDDVYDGNVTIEFEKCWRLVWRVRGPRKDFTLDTRYDRD